VLCTLCTNINNNNYIVSKKQKLTIKSSVKKMCFQPALETVQSRCSSECSNVVFLENGIYPKVQQKLITDVRRFERFVVGFLAAVHSM